MSQNRFYNEPIEIPGPPGYPIIGNILDLQDEVPLNAIERFCDIYGPLIKFRVGQEERIAVGGYEIFNELCDDTRFFKLVQGQLDKNKTSKATGLFLSASEYESDWQQAHRILMPAFGPLNIETMFDEMHDIASQMVLKWARQGSDFKIKATDDFSRLTLDTIALCTMDFRFNSFYSDEMHPFIVAMNNTLSESSNRNQLKNRFMSLFPSHNEQLKKDSEYQTEMSMSLVKHRKDNPTDKRDLVNAMLYTKDPKTGEPMRDELVAVNMRTFLIAGHETTSGLLSFAFALLLKNPKAYYAAQEEVDRVCGKDKITVKHLKDLKYINALLKETLRLHPTVPAFHRAVRPENKEETVYLANGKFVLPRDKSVVCLLGKIHRDPAVWGDDADEFKPERMYEENMKNLPKNAHKPFGTGVRACIGRAFAWQEALLAVTLILQNFDVKLDDPNYQMKIQQILTTKPKDFYMRASLRRGTTAMDLQRRLNGSEPDAALEAAEAAAASAAAANGSQAGVNIFYGSNTGTCQAFAQKLASKLAVSGLAPKVADLDSAVTKISNDVPNVIISSSYEGQPPDNAESFVAWVEKLAKGSLDGVNFAVFGCGHSDWVSTYQRIPNLIDECLARAGATRLTEKDSVDVSKGDVTETFDKWCKEKLMPAVTSGTGTLKSSPEQDSFIDLKVSTEERAVHLQQGVEWCNVIEGRELTPEKGGSRHVEFALPSSMTYRTGDYLAVLPQNPDEVVRRVINRFGLPWDGVVTINNNMGTTLPTGKPMPIFDLLRGYVELSQPASREDMELLKNKVTEASQREDLESLMSNPQFKTEIVDRRVTLLDLLERFQDSTMPFQQFLGLLPPLKPRYYSISSSPLVHPTQCSLTYSVVDAPSWSPDSGRFLGVASNYLRSLRAGDRALVSVRSANKYFHLPKNQEETPVVMLCAGTGLAPFRGFVQERATLIREGGRKLAPALLLIGCRSRDHVLYREELEKWQRLGAVEVKYAFSREPEAADGCKYVQDRLLAETERIREMWAAGAKFYTCGSGAMARGVSDAASQILRKAREEDGDEVSDEQIQAWKQSMRNERFLMDVFD